MLLVLVVLDTLLKIRIMTKPTQQEPCSECKPANHSSQDFCHSCGRFLNRFRLNISKTTYAKALLIIIASSAVYVTINAPSFATGQNSVELSGASYTNATSILPPMPNSSLLFLYRDSEYEQIAHVDLSLLYAYYSINPSKPAIFTDIGVASTQSNLHSWEVCYITYQTSLGHFPIVNEIETDQVKLQGSTTAEFLTFLNPNGNYTQMTLYWYDKATFKTGFTVSQKYVRISLIIIANATYDANANDPSAIQKNKIEYLQDLTEAGNRIALVWAPMRAQALISLGIPAQQALLAVLGTVLVITIITQNISEKRKAAHNKQVFNSYASYKERIVLQTVQNLAKQKKNHKTIDIATSIQNKIGKPVNLKQVYYILETLEKSGLVKRRLISVSNSSSQEWSL